MAEADGGESGGGGGAAPVSTPEPAPQTTTEEPPAWAKPLIETQQTIARTLESLSNLIPQVNPNPTADNPQPVASTPDPQPQADTPPAASEADPPQPKKRRGLLSQGVKIRF